MSDEPTPTPTYQAPGNRPLDDVEKARIEMETRKVDAERREAEARAQASEIALKDLREQTRRRDLLDDFTYRRYHFDDPVNSGSVESCIRQLKVWDRDDSQCDIELAFSSPGGSVIDGMELFDYVAALSLRHGGKHKVTTSCYGMAASMAGILLQVGDERVCGPQAYILIHEVSFGAGGKIGEVKDEVKFVEKVQERVLDIFAARSTEAGKAGTATRSLTRLEFAKGGPDDVFTDASGTERTYEIRGWDRTDWWLGSDEALRWGVVDRVG